MVTSGNWEYLQSAIEWHRWLLKCILNQGLRKYLVQTLMDIDQIRMRIKHYKRVGENSGGAKWGIGLVIVGFFENISHDKLMLAVEKHVPESWIRLYITRWLTAPVLKKTGELITKQGKGTPQGGVISPLLANLFLHYGFDKWLEQMDKTVNYSRYADDVIVHCRSKQHAEQTLKLIRVC